MEIKMLERIFLRLLIFGAEDSNRWAISGMIDISGMGWESGMGSALYAHLSGIEPEPLNTSNRGMGLLWVIIEALRAAGQFPM